MGFQLKFLLDQMSYRTRKFHVIDQVDGLMMVMVNMQCHANFPLQNLKR